LVITILLPLTIIILTLFIAPGYLAYADKPTKSDAVILFCGDENKTREMEVKKLLHEGYARFLIIPACGEVQQVMLDGSMKRLSRDTKLGDLLFKLRKRAFYKKHYEDTHIEVLEAKRMMDETGLHSAILVSSPCHMRRIWLIARKVFGDRKQTFCCVPTSFERSFAAGDWFNRHGRDVIISEYAKLGWFMLYGIVS
jgi:hypothetical protein